MNGPVGQPGASPCAAEGVLLQGFSGARLEIVSRDGRGWVRKSSRDAERLGAERRKIVWLAGVGLASGLFEVPMLGGTGTDSSGAWYEIEYVPGRSVESIAATDGHAGGIGMGLRLARIVGSLGGSMRGPDARTHERFLREKLGQTADVVRTRCADGVSLRSAGEMFVSRAATLDVAHAADEAARRGGGCHGDLALDNALVDRAGRIVLIDPLASASESVYWDAAKVLQSTLACWGGIKVDDVRRERHGYSAPRPGGLVALHAAFLGGVLGAGLDERTLGVHLVVTLSRVMRYVDGRRLGALLAATNELMDRLSAGGKGLDEPLDSLRGTVEPVLDVGSEVPPGDAGRADDARTRGAGVRRVG